MRQLLSIRIANWQVHRLLGRPETFQDWRPRKLEASLRGRLNSFRDPKFKIQNSKRKIQSTKREVPTQHYKNLPQYL